MILQLKFLEAKVEYLGLETEKTATMGKNCYDVTDIINIYILIYIILIFD